MKPVSNLRKNDFMLYQQNEKLIRQTIVNNYIKTDNHYYFPACG
jgi:hypothetical protein